ncbi:MAG TPA: alpha/beta hydrolase [Pyrinomonadaceae bacterium]|jgi:pimeloyl-ACP methyl ester carboxylesterase|nr:alpha/beta hydrolase [Pyrinomonadaceae bacterium]
MKKTRFFLLLTIALCLSALTNAQTPKEITIYGQKIHYLEAGSGPNLILLHGLGGSSQVWQFNIGPLAEKYHVFVPDQIGFGKSDKPLVNYRIRTYVDFLDQFCKQLKIERPSLIGNSMGGWIAAIYAATYPDRVDKLVLADAAGYAPPKDFDTRTFFGLNPTTKAEMKILVGKVFYNKAFQSDAAIDQSMTVRLGAGDGYTIKSITDSIIRGEDFLDDVVKSIKSPTLLVWGREDGLVPLSDGERLHKDIAGSTLVVIEECGHIPNVEKAGEFNAAVLKFLGAQ